MGTFRIVSFHLGFEPEAIPARLPSCGLKIEKTLELLDPLGARFKIVNEWRFVLPRLYLNEVEVGIDQKRHHEPNNQDRHQPAQ